jgi:FKBP-type peptidyl-prolyl cis-trans isomerase SlyD
MQVHANCVITLDVEMRLTNGEDVTDDLETIEYLHGGYDNIFPKLEEALESKAIGEIVEMSLDPEDAFGDYDPELLRVEERKLFPKELQIGMNFEGVPSDEEEADGEDEDEGIIFTVTDIEDDKVILDGNHPLAGERLWVRAKITAIREATEEEVEHGHAHGAYGVEHAVEDGYAESAPEKKTVH